VALACTSWSDRPMRRRAQARPASDDAHEVYDSVKPSRLSPRACPIQVSEVRGRDMGFGATSPGLLMHEQYRPIVIVNEELGAPAK